MATTLTWIGSVSGDVNVAGNWSPAQVPIGGDSIIMNDKAQAAMTASLGTFAAMKFGSFHVGNSCNFAVGTGAADGSGLKFAAAKLVHQGTAAFYYEAVALGVNKTDLIIVNSSNRELAMNVNATAAAQIDTFNGTAGNIVFTGSGITMSSLIISYRSSINSDTIMSSTGTFDLSPTIFMKGGFVTTQFLAGETFCMGGKLVIEYNSSTPVIGTGFYIGGNAEVVYKGDSVVPLIELRSGTLDLTQRSHEATVTILRRWPGTILKTNDLVTITNTEDMTGGDI